MRISRKLISEFCSLAYMSTRRSYSSVLGEFEGVWAELHTIQGIVSSWHDLPEGTISVKRAALNGLLEYSESLGLDKTIRELLKYPRGIETKHGRPITDSEKAAMRESIRTGEERIVIAILEDLGLRLGTLANLKVRHLVSDTPSKVKGKGKSQALIIPTERLSKLVSDYANMNNLKSEDYIFTGYNGGKPRYQDIWSIFDVIRRRAGLRGELKPHYYRHRFATDMNSIGATMPEIQELMGHRSPVSTAGYITLNKDDLHAMLEKRSGV